MLAERLLQRYFPSVPKELQPEELDESTQDSLAAHLNSKDLGGYLSKLVENGYDSLELVKECLADGSLHGILTEEIEMTESEAERLLKSLAVTELPLMEHALFQERRAEIEVVFESVYPAMNFQQTYDHVRKTLPQKVHQSFTSEFVTTSSFLETFKNYVSNEQERLMKQHFFDTARKLAEQEVVDIKGDLLRANKSVQQAEQAAAQLRSKMEEGPLSILKQKITEKVDPCIRQGLSGLPHVRRTLNQVVDLLSMLEPEKLTGDIIADAADGHLSVAWANNVSRTRFDRDGSVSGQETVGAYGRLLCSEDRLQALASAFVVFIAGLIGENIVDIAFTALEEWLDEELEGDLSKEAKVGMELEPKAEIVKMSIDGQIEESIIPRHNKAPVLSAMVGRYTYTMTRPFREYYQTEVVEALRNMDQRQFWLGPYPDNPDDKDVLKVAQVCELKPQFWRSLSNLARGRAVGAVELCLTAIAIKYLELAANANQRKVDELKGDDPATQNGVSQENSIARLRERQTSTEHALGLLEILVSTADELRH
jgi:hypothetical protein